MKELPSESSSAWVMLSQMIIIRFIRIDVSSSDPSISPCGMPGIIDAILDKGPLTQQQRHQ